jgi:hypothetical protein
MVGIERVLGFVILFLTKAKKTLNTCSAMSAADPVTFCTPFELSCFRRFSKHFSGTQQKLYIYPIVDFFVGHGFILCLEFMNSKA